MTRAMLSFAIVIGLACVALEQRPGACQAAAYTTSGRLLCDEAKRAVDRAAARLLHVAEKMPADEYRLQVVPDIPTFAATLGWAIDVRMGTCTAMTGTERQIKASNMNAKGLTRIGSTNQPKRRQVTADTLVRAYQREVDRQKLLVKRASLNQNRLLFIVNGLRRLLDDEDFVTLLRADGLQTLPAPIVQRIRAVKE